MNIAPQIGFASGTTAPQFMTRRFLCVIFASVFLPFPNCGAVVLLAPFCGAVVLLAPFCGAARLMFVQFWWVIMVSSSECWLWAILMSDNSKWGWFGIFWSCSIAHVMRHLLYLCGEGGESMETILFRNIFLFLVFLEGLLGEFYCEPSWCRILANEDDLESSDHALSRMWRGICCIFAAQAANRRKLYSFEIIFYFLTKDIFSLCFLTQH